MKTANRQILRLANLFFTERSGDEQTRVVIHILCLIVIELACWNNFTGYGSLKVIVAKHADFDLASINSLLDDNLSVELCRNRECSRQFSGIVSFRNSNG